MQLHKYLSELLSGKHSWTASKWIIKIEIKGIRAHGDGKGSLCGGGSMRRQASKWLWIFQLKIQIVHFPNEIPKLSKASIRAFAPIIHASNICTRCGRSFGIGLVKKGLLVASWDKRSFLWAAKSCCIMSKSSPPGQPDKNSRKFEKHRIIK